VHVIHHSYYGHPYYGRHYWDGWWYRRPTVYVHNHHYSSDRHSVSRFRYSRGDDWRPRHENRRRLHDQRIARSDYYTGRSVRHRSAAATTTQIMARRAQHNHNARAVADRRQAYSARSVSADRDQANRAAIPAASRQARPPAARAERDSGQRRDTNVQRQHGRTEQVVRRAPVAAERRGAQRASADRQERRTAAPRQEAPPRSRPQRPKAEDPARTIERRRNASPRNVSRRQQRR
jgi:hypothetical protein